MQSKCGLSERSYLSCGCTSPRSCGAAATTSILVGARSLPLRDHNGGRSASSGKALTSTGQLSARLCLAPGGGRGESQLIASHPLGSLPPLLLADGLARTLVRLICRLWGCRRGALPGAPLRPRSSAALPGGCTASRPSRRSAPSSVHADGVSSRREAALETRTSRPGPRLCAEDGRGNSTIVCSASAIHNAEATGGWDLAEGRNFARQMRMGHAHASLIAYSLDPSCLMAQTLT